jgi:tyrosine-protein phosphatase SIW14
MARVCAPAGDARTSGVPRVFPATASSAPVGSSAAGARSSRRHFAGARSVGRHVANAGVLACALACALAAGCQPTSSPAAAVDVNKTGIVNFAAVDDGILYRGAQPDPAGFAALKDLGIKTVITLRNAHEDAPLAAPLDLDLVTIPLKATTAIELPDDDAIRSFFAVLNDPARRPVYLHCALGKDRTGAMAALWRIEHDDWTPQQALTEMRAFGYHETAYAELTHFILGWHKRGLSPH